MAEFARLQAPSVAELHRLFGTGSTFTDNVPALLELRLAQVAPQDADRSLLSYVENAIRDLEPNPELALTWVRSIATRGLRLIWEAELGAGLELPREWVSKWQAAGVNFSDDQGRIPKGYGAQCNILRLATGTEKVSRLARYVTKPTFLLLDHLQSVGDFGQHRDDYPESEITTGVAAAIVLTAIELVGALSRDIAKKPGS